MLFPSCSGTLWWYSNKSRIDEIHHRGSSRVCQSILVSGIIAGGTEESFWHHWMPLERPQMRRSLTSITQFLKQLHMELVGNANKMLCIVLGTIEGCAGSRIAILANEIFCNHDLRHNTSRLHWPCDCSRRRSSTVRTACDTKARTQGHVDAELAKASSRSRSSPFHSQTYLIYGNRERPGKARQKCKTTRNKHITEADQATRKLVKTTSDMNVDTHLCAKEVSTNALLKNEAVKEELKDTNTKAIERIKICSNKICIREDLAKEKMVFSQESSQAIFEMGNVELTELKTSMNPCPSCLHNVFKGTFLCRGGKHIRPDLDMLRRVKDASEILKAPCCRTSAITARLQTWP